MLLLRHASAGERLASPTDDRPRRLDAAGRADALALAAVLSAHAIERIVSSPHARCLESVEPLARLRGLTVEPREELAPGASQDETLALLGEVRDNSLVCTHREVFERLFGGEITCEKGGTWIVEGGVPVAYLPPPSSALSARRAATARPRGRRRARVRARRSRP
jgi:phosphohistidine phosphatase SixA